MAISFLAENRLMIVNSATGHGFTDPQHCHLMVGAPVRDSAGYKRTLSTFRHLLFARHNCQLRLRDKHLELTYVDKGQGELQMGLQKLMHRRSERGLNRVSFWGGLGLKVEFQDQYTNIAS